MSENRCVCCGEIIPEGMQVCVNCLTKENERLKERCYMIADGDLCGYCSYVCNHRREAYKGVAKCE